MPSLLTFAGKNERFFKEMEEFVAILYDYEYKKSTEIVRLKEADKIFKENHKF